MAVWLAGACGHADVIMECLLGLMFITETIPLLISIAVVIVLSLISFYLT